jgi:iron-sulfur cluster assembly protein
VSAAPAPGSPGTVLTLTPSAAEIVRTLVEQSAAPDSCGLRIAASTDVGGESVALELALVEEPEALDETIEQEGATVYLDPEAAELLDDKLLDAQVAEDHVTFVLREDDADEGPFQPFSMDEDAHDRRNGHASPNGDGPH